MFKSRTELKIIEARQKQRKDDLGETNEIHLLEQEMTKGKLKQMFVGSKRIKDEMFN